MSMGLLMCVGADINEYGVIDVCVGSDINEYGVIDVCGTIY